ncbi:hypothetical protein Tco_1447632 [Tanacetum coccineum]
MAEQQTITYSPQWNNMTVDDVVFQTNNVVGNFNYPPNVPAYKPIMKFLLNYPLNKAFTNCPSVVYQNFLMEFWSTVVAFDPFLSTDKPEKRPLKEFLIKFSILNGQRPLTLDFKTFCSKTGLDYNNGKYVAHPSPEVLSGNYSSTNNDLITKLLNNSRLKYVSYPRFMSCALQVLLGSDYTQDKKFGFLHPVLSNSNFTKDPSKVTNIELMAHMIAVNNRRDSVSPPPLAPKPKKGKSQTVTPTLPKSQGPEASGALSKKRKKPKSKKPPTRTKVTPPKPTESSEQSYSISSTTVPNPQDLNRDIQLASTGFPSTLDEGTRKSKPLLEGSATHPQDSRGNKQPFDRDTTSMTPNKGPAKTTPRPEGSLGDKDSGGNIPLTDMEPIRTPIVDPLGTGAKYQEVLAVGDDMDEDPQDNKEVRTPSPKQDQSKPSHVQESASDSSSPDLKKFDNTLPLTERQLIKYLRKVSKVLFNRITKKQWEQHEEAAVSYADLKASIDQYYDENIAHRDQTDKLVEASMSSLNRSSTTISDLYKGLYVITQLLKDINNAGFDFSALPSAVKSLRDHALKQDEASTAWMKSSTNMAWNLSSRMSGVELSQTALKR